MINNQRINLEITNKDGQFMAIRVKETDLVYQTIKNQYNCDNDILVVSGDQVCYFDETFSSFKNRISKDNDLRITVQSLSQVYQQFFDFQNGNKNENISQIRSDNIINIMQNESINEFNQINQDRQIVKFENKQSLNIQDGTQIEQNYDLMPILNDEIYGQSNLQNIEQQIIKKSSQLLFKIVTDPKQSFIFANSKSMQQENKSYERDTQVISMIQRCFLCNNSIDQQRIQLQCQHNYHEDCLVSLFLGQLQNQNAALSCLCYVKQKAPILQHIKDKDSQQILRHKLLQNQLNSIIQTNQLEKCQTKTCYFYFKRNPQLQLQKSFCPLCLII